MEYVLPSVFGWPRSLFGVSRLVSWAPSPSRWVPPRGPNTSQPPPPPEVGVVLEGGDEHVEEEDHEIHGKSEKHENRGNRESRGNFGDNGDVESVDENGEALKQGGGSTGSDERSPLPRVTAWYGGCCEIRAFENNREAMLTHWLRMDERGHFDAIREEVRRSGGNRDGSGKGPGEIFKWKYP